MLDECILKYMYIPIYLKLRAQSAGHTLHAPSVSIKSALFIYAHFIVFFRQFVYSPKSAKETARTYR